MDRLCRKAGRLKTPHLSLFSKNHMTRFSTSMARVLTGSALVLAASLALPAQAQPGSGGPTPGATTAVPIDGGASLLLAGGVAYGLKQLRARRAARRKA
jgi:hypothetical protein